MARESFTASSKENFKTTRNFSGFQTMDLTYNLENPNNWVITELWDSKETYEKYLQSRHEDGTFDEVVSVYMDLP